MRRVMAIVLCACSMVGCAHVQATESWTELVNRLRIGKSVVVTTSDPIEVRGKISAVSADSLTLVVDRVQRKFDVKDVRQVRRDGDPLWNGLAIGVGVGLLGAVLPDNKCSGQPTRCDDKQIPQRVAFLAAATAAGVGIDALHRDRTVLYKSHLIDRPARFNVFSGSGEEDLEGSLCGFTWTQRPLMSPWWCARNGKVAHEANRSPRK